MGDRVLVNEALVVVGPAGRRAAGELMHLRERLGERAALVTAANDEEVVVELADGLAGEPLEIGQSLLGDHRALLAWATVPRSDVAELVLDEVPDVTWADIGGLTEQIQQIRDAVELPFTHRGLYRDFELEPPKGVLLYGPPGCGKTMIAKAVANAAGSSFLNVKGPELLNKYVGETERQIRQTFARARAEAEAGRPVIVFFDEMDSLFRTRGSGVSSDVESTIVPQLLAELDGVEAMSDVIVIGATNREDLIDPALLRPGRLDVKIRLDRPDEASARAILGLALSPRTPLDAAEAEAAGGAEAFRSALIERAVADLFERRPANASVEVTYASGRREVLYVADFISGALLANVAARAKQAAIKDLIAGGPRGVGTEHIRRAVRAEVAQNEDLPSAAQPEEWALISGRRGEPIVGLRRLAGAGAATVERPGDGSPG
ncbi:proteasome ATPase [Propioniciclava coleopterorum]|uniref:Proteasome ATPase n=1 Tax=Propioniciclava coleopterorum TaxID=2714937 RepID=A0A6G7YA99_9ACTN|nr:proteasome ATPase [Propioniciclava coleopterorum]QIK73537.1 proteasome ATPase [Propioniciclava coleopterorum]